MLIRIADSLFWMTRYMERTEGILRMIKTNYMSSLENIEESDFTWRPVLKTFTTLSDEQISAMEYNSMDVLKYLISDKSNDNSVLNTVTSSRENARGVQDHITIEVWECLNKFYLEVTKWEQIEFDSSEVIATLTHFMQNALLYYGIAEVTMPRKDGWNFMNLGKFIERAFQTSLFLQSKFEEFDYDMQKTSNPIEWRHVLQSVSGFEFYLKTYHTGIQAENVVDMLVLNSDFPRSVFYSVVRLHQILERFRNSANNEAYNKIDYNLGKLKSRIQYSNVNEIAKEGLKNYLETMIDDLYVIGNLINEFIFHYN